jgi:hypothetical protein
MRLLNLDHHRHLLILLDMATRILARAAVALRLLSTILCDAEALAAASDGGSTSTSRILGSNRDYRLVEVAPHDTSSFTCVALRSFSPVRRSFLDAFYYLP